MAELSKLYEERLEQLDDETLTTIAEDRTKAVTYARIGIGVIEPENVKDEYIDAVATEMQTVSKMLLKERKIN